MAITKRNIMFPELGTPRPSSFVLFGTITIGAAGAVSTNSADYPDGFTVAQTGSEDGRYTVTLQGGGVTKMVPHVQMVDTTDTALPTTTGVNPFLRNVSASAGTFDFQTYRTDTNADTDPASGSIFCITIYCME